MKLKIIQLILIALSIASFSSCSNSLNKNEWEVMSPNEKIKVSIKLQSDSDSVTSDQKYGNIFYKVDYIDDEKQTVVKYSQLGIEMNQQSFVDSLKFLSSNQRTFVEEYSLLHGKKSKIKLEGKELLLKFENNKGGRINISFRTFNDGVSFRYEFPEKSKDEFTILSEHSKYVLPKTSKSTIQSYQEANKWGPAYELPYLVDLPLDSLINKDNEWAFPALFNISNKKIWMLITESNLDKNYCGSHLEFDKTQSSFKIKFPRVGEGNSTGNVYPKTKMPFYTPWRVMIIGNSLSKIVESTLVTDLSEPNKLKDVSWIKPGKASWSWWSDNDSPQNPKTLRRFIDLANSMNWEYSLVDANWNKMNQDTLLGIVDYSKRKNVGLIFWYNSGGKHNTVEEEPRDRMMSEKREKEFRWLSDIGVKGVKVDFFQSDKQQMIEHYVGILEDAAKHKIMVNFHGSTIPRGWSRTYPNMMTLESVIGAESYIFNKDYPEVAPILNSILPFTRNAIGPMDYTPVTFSNNKYARKTSMAHEVALSVLFESGWQHFADRTEAYTSLSEDVKIFLKEIPSTWDDIKFVSGYPGESIILARRAGEVWYVAGINAKDNSKIIEFTLPFLKDGKWNMQIISDGENFNSFSHETRVINSREIISINMLAFGGFTALVTQ